jgi:hypothetical protein
VILLPLEVSQVSTGPCTPDAARSAAQSFAVAGRWARLVWPPWSEPGPSVQLVAVASPLTAQVLIARPALQAVPQVASAQLELQELVVLPPAEEAAGPVP